MHQEDLNKQKRCTLDVWLDSNTKKTNEVAEVMNGGEKGSVTAL